MDSKERVLELIKSLKGGKIQKDLFELCIEFLAKETLENGLSETELETIVDVIITAKMAGNWRKELLQCLIPRTTVSQKAVKDILLWIFSFYRTEPLMTIVAALQWITGLIDYDLTDQEVIDGFYDLYYSILSRHQLVPFVCKILHLLTKASYVSRWRVQQILKLQKLYGRKRHTDALLCLFKSLRPDCVPEPIPAVGVVSAFKNLPVGFTARFENAERRKQATSGKKQSLPKKIVWNTELQVTRVRSKKKKPLIPLVDYVLFEASQYRDKKTFSVLNFDDLESLATHQLSLDIPANVLALLSNDAGHHIIAFGGTELQRRFSFVLYHSLHEAFINKSDNFSPEQKDTFLKNLVAFEEYIQQGIPVVSFFLSRYLRFWDGLEYSEHIFRLLEWTTFSSFYELNECILSKLKTHFLVSNVGIKSIIIASLSRFLKNVVDFKSSTAGTRSGVFLESRQSFDVEITAQKIINFITELCVSGLIMHNGAYLLLNEVLEFYETVSYVEERRNLSMWTVIPPCVMYWGLFSPNIFFMARVCKLLLRYRHISFPRVKGMGLRRRFVSEVDMLNRYSEDLSNCLLSETAFSRRETGYIFKKIPSKTIKELSTYTEVETAFDLTNHFAFAPYIALVKNNTDDKDEKFTKDDILQLLSQNFKEIPKVCEAVKDRFW